MQSKFCVFTKEKTNPTNVAKKNPTTSKSRYSGSVSLLKVVTVPLASQLFFRGSLSLKFIKRNLENYLLLCSNQLSKAAFLKCFTLKLYTIKHCILNFGAAYLNIFIQQVLF